MVFCIDVTSSQKVTESRYEIPLRLAACASASLLAQQKFDSAQDDRLIFGLIIIVRGGASRVSLWLGPANKRIPQIKTGDS